MRLSVVIPAHNSARDLDKVLEALLPQLDPSSGDQCIVADDASTDATGAVAERAGATVVRTPHQSGPAAVRNLGAVQATGEVLVFLDADTVPQAGLLDRIRRHFAADPELAAVMGSYDDAPQHPALVSRFRNLLHCYTHRTGSRDASTFWAGCGAMRSQVFERFQGFDEKRFPRPSIEDIELGVRLRRQGLRILLDPDLQVKHRKRWTLTGMIATDVWRRAVPWTALILESRQAPADLNLKPAQRLSAAATALAVMVLPLLLWNPRLVIVTVVLLAAATMLNLPFYRFLAGAGGWWFAVRSVPLHWIYFLSSVAGFGIGLVRHLVGRRHPARDASGSPAG